MKKRIKDIGTKTRAELTELLSAKRGELHALRFSSAGARPKDPSEAPKLRADIARILTARKNATN